MWLTDLNVGHQVKFRFMGKEVRLKLLKIQSKGKVRIGIEADKTVKLEVKRDEKEADINGNVRDPDEY